MSGNRPKERLTTEELFRTHAPFVARFLHRFGVSADELDDAVQEVFLVVHRNGGYEQGPATPRSYLASIAVRAASSYRRRGKARADRRAAVSPERVRSAGRDPVQLLETHEALVRLQAALDQLEPTLKATLMLVELEGESCQAIAASLRIPVGTVYWRLHRARKKFRLAAEALEQCAEASSSESRLERKVEKMAVLTIFFPRSRSRADALLDAGRAQASVEYDAAKALLRHQELVQAGAPLPSWAASGAATAAATSTGALVLASVAGIAGVFVASAVTAALVFRHPALKAVVVPGATVALVAPAVAPGGASRPPVPVAVVASLAPTSPAAPRPAASYATPAGTPARGHEVPGSVAIERRTARVERGEIAPDPTPEPTPEPMPTPTPAQVPAPAPRPSPGPDDMEELREVAAAEGLLATDPSRALALVRSGESRFPGGYLREERRYIGVAALFKLGRADQGRTEAALFLKDYPDGPFSQRVRSAMTHGP